MKNSQKIRISRNGVIIFTTVGKYPSLFGDTTSYSATKFALDRIDELKKNGGECCGLGTTWNGHQIQVSLM